MQLWCIWHEFKLNFPRLIVLKVGHQSCVVATSPAVDSDCWLLEHPQELLGMQMHRQQVCASEAEST